MLVTGAAGGIGRAVCRRLVAAGAEIVAWDNAPDVTSIEGVDGDVIDLTDAAAAAAACAALGPVDGLVHTAGVLTDNRALDSDLDPWRGQWAGNVLAAVNVCAPIARGMAERGAGAIVGVTSNAAATPRAGMAAYGATKAALQSYLRTLALEVAPFGVRCNTVSPGSTDTAMLRRLHRDDAADGPADPLADPLTADETGRVVAGDPATFRLGIPLGRVAHPDDVAAACLFLLSDAARHVTMHDLRVDGGATFDA